MDDNNNDTQWHGGQQQPMDNRVDDEVDNDNNSNWGGRWPKRLQHQGHETDVSCAPDVYVFFDMYGFLFHFTLLTFNVDYDNWCGGCYNFKELWTNS